MERAGVHSGDSMAVYQNLTEKLTRSLIIRSGSDGLGVKGLLNISLL